MNKFFNSTLPLFFRSFAQGGLLPTILVSVVALIALACFGVIGAWSLIGGLVFVLVGGLYIFAHCVSVTFSRRPLYEDARYREKAHAIGKGGPRGATYLHRTAEEDAIFERECGGDILEYIVRMYPGYLTPEEVATLKG